MIYKFHIKLKLMINM